MAIFRNIICFSFLLLPVLVFASDYKWLDLTGEIESALYSSLKTYEAGETNEAMEEVADVYFGIFESEKANMEIAVRMYLSLKKSTALEKSFTNIRRAMNNKKPKKEIEKKIKDLASELKEAARELDSRGISLKQTFK